MCQQLCSQVSYGTVINSPIHLDFKEQAEMIPLYERIYASLVTDYRPSDNLVQTAEEGFAKVPFVDLFPFLI